MDAARGGVSWRHRDYKAEATYFNLVDIWHFEACFTDLFDVFDVAAMMSRINVRRRVRSTLSSLIRNANGTELASLLRVDEGFPGLKALCLARQWAVYQVQIEVVFIKVDHQPVLC